MHTHTHTHITPETQGEEGNREVETTAGYTSLSALYVACPPEPTTRGPKGQRRNATKEQH